MRVVRELEPDLAVDGLLQYDAAAIAGAYRDPVPGPVAAFR